MRDYHPKVVTLQAPKTYDVDYRAVVDLEEALKAAGVSDVRVGSCGFAAQ